MASAGSGVESRWNLALAQAGSFRTMPRARPMHDAAKNSGPHGRGLAGPLPAGPAAGKKGNSLDRRGRVWLKMGPTHGATPGSKDPMPPLQKIFLPGAPCLAMPCVVHALVSGTGRDGLWD